MTDFDDDLRSNLNAETGKITWKELERHYARGVVVVVATDVDLIDVATGFVLDDKPAVERWLVEGTVARATTEHAIRWNADNPTFWAVVTAPWVLVQEHITAEGVH